jgi:TPR repeat protein
MCRASRLLIVTLAGTMCACASMRPTRQQEWVLTKFKQCQSETNAINVNLDRVLPDGTYYTSSAQTPTEYNRLVACMKDDEASLRMYRREAAAGTGWAMTSLGAFYETGRGGLEKNETEAVAWYRRGVDAGDGLAMANLGNFYMSGRGGVTRDDAEAARLHRRGAELNEAAGMYRLGWAHENGRGVTKDRAEAIAWYRKAATQGYKAATDRLKTLGE